MEKYMILIPADAYLDRTRLEQLDGETFHDIQEVANKLGIYKEVLDVMSMGTFVTMFNDTDDEQSMINIQENWVLSVNLETVEDDPGAYKKFMLDLISGYPETGGLGVDNIPGTLRLLANSLDNLADGLLPFLVREVHEGARNDLGMITPAEIHRVMDTVVRDVEGFRNGAVRAVDNYLKTRGQYPV